GGVGGRWCVVGAGRAGGGSEPAGGFMVTKGLAAAALLLGLFACGKTLETAPGGGGAVGAGGESAATCKAGERASCVCGGGRSGTKTCRSDRSGYFPCNCGAD